jgi:hypothetical protein
MRHPAFPGPCGISHCPCPCGISHCPCPCGISHCPAHATFRIPWPMRNPPGALPHRLISVPAHSFRQPSQEFAAFPPYHSVHDGIRHLPLPHLGLAPRSAGTDMHLPPSVRFAYSFPSFPTRLKGPKWRSWRDSASLDILTNYTLHCCGCTGDFSIKDCLSSHNKMTSGIRHATRLVPLSVSSKTFWPLYASRLNCSSVEYLDLRCHPRNHLHRSLGVTSPFRMTLTTSNQALANGYVYARTTGSAHISPYRRFGLK